MYKTGEGQPKERDEMWNYTNTQQTLKPFTIYLFRALFRARARIYVIYFLKKHSHLHTPHQNNWFSAIYGMNTLHFKPSHATPSIHTWQILWRTVNLIFFIVSLISVQVWRVENASVHTLFLWKSAIKDRFVKEWMLFFGIKIRIEEHDFWGR